MTSQSMNTAAANGETQVPHAAPLRFRVTGMTCAGCAAGLQRRLNADVRIQSATVSISTNIATVNSAAAAATDIIAIIEEHGFAAATVSAEHPAVSDLQQTRHPHSAAELWKRRAALGMGLWLPLEFLHWYATATAWHAELLPWLMFAGVSAVIAVAAPGFLSSAIRAARRRTSNMDTLISLGALTAYLTSTVTLFLELDWPLYFTEAAGLLAIVSTGHWLEARASQNAGSASAELLKLQPQLCEVQQSDGSFRFMPAASLNVGQLLRIRPGTRIPADGVVVSGVSDIDESLITGESSLRTRQVDDEVVAGSMNTTGQLILRATSPGNRTTVHELADLVERAQSSPAPVQRLADQISAVFVPAVLLIAMLTCTMWALCGDLQTGIISAVTVLIISCPCALGLATPLAVSVGIGAASQRGMLIRNAAALEAIGRAGRIVFDKTGTLTFGRPAIDAFETEPGFSEANVLQLAAAVEQYSEHPVARAVVAAAEAHNLPLIEATDFSAEPGFGVQGTAAGHRIRVFRDPGCGAAIEIDGRHAASFSFSDQLRSDAASSVQELQKLQLLVEILSGDRRESALQTAQQLGIAQEHVFAEMTPLQKLTHLRNSAQLTIMVGDGLNDTAALAESQLGVTMTSATDAARAASAVVLTGDRVAAVAELVHLARRTLRVIQQNLVFAFFYNMTAIPLAACGLLGEHGPLWAAAAMGLSDLTVVGNALRLRRQLAGNTA